MRRNCSHMSLALALLGTRAAAQESPPAETYAPAQLVEQRAPSYPANALSSGREGWVTLSYVISPTGEVTEAMIVESSHQAFEDPARRAVLGWRYEPARRDGEPVEEAMVETTIRFDLEGVTGARPVFHRKYTEIIDLLQTGDLHGAAAALDELDRNGQFNLYEDAWFWFAKALYLEAAEPSDTDARVQALQRATRPGDVYLSPDLFVSALRKLYTLQAQRNELGAVVEVFERLRDSREARGAENYSATLAAMRSGYDRIMTAVEGVQPIAVPSKIGEHYYSFHKLLRRSFALDSVDGRIDVVDIRCGKGTGRFAFTSEDQRWTVPASWGDCRVYIKGEPGTTFRLLALPDNAP